MEQRRRVHSELSGLARATTASIVAMLLAACGASSGTTSVSTPAAHSLTRTSAPTTYKVGGTVSGLSSSGLVLELNGSQDLAIGANGAFSFPDAISGGNSYTVTVKWQPSSYREFCTVSNASGVSQSDVSSVTVDCSILLGFVYYGGTGSPDGTITSYGILSGSGALVPLGQSAVTTGESPVQLVAAPSGHFLYSVSLASSPEGISDFSIFAVDGGTGSLARVGSVATTSEVTAAALTPTGDLLFAGTLDGTILTFTVDASSGNLSAAGTAKLTHPFASNIDTIAAAPDGRHFYVLQSDGAGSSTFLNVFSIDPASGTPTAIQSVALSGLPTSLAADPLGRFLFLANDALATSISSMSTVTPYAVDAQTGSVSPAASALQLVGNSSSIATEPKGRFLYVVSSYDDVITTLAVDPVSGGLSEVGAAQHIGSAAVQAATDPSGRFVYVAGLGVASDSQIDYHDVTGYSISSTAATLGQLSLIGYGADIKQSTQGRTIAIVE
jgi:6-phosphogluconolactonase